MKYRLQAILFVFVAFILDCNEYMIVGVLPDIAHQYHDSLSKLGLLVTVFALVYAVFTPLIKSMANRWKRHHVLLFLMVIFFIGNTWTAMATNFVSMLFSRILTVSVAGAIISLVLVMASFVAPREKRASLVSWVFAGFSIASVVGIPIGTIVSHAFTWHDSFWMITGLTIVVFVLLLWLVPRDTPQVKSSFKNQFVLLKDVRVLLGVTFIVCVCAADYSIYTYIRPLITDGMGFDYSWLNWLLFGMGGLLHYWQQVRGICCRPWRCSSPVADLCGYDPSLSLVCDRLVHEMDRNRGARPVVYRLFLLRFIHPADVFGHRRKGIPAITRPGIFFELHFC